MKKEDNFQDSVFVFDASKYAEVTIVSHRFRIQAEHPKSSKHTELIARARRLIAARCINCGAF
jgi:hypothetical protein